MRSWPECHVADSLTAALVARFHDEIGSTFNTVDAVSGLCFFLTGCFFFDLTHWLDLSTVAPCNRLHNADLEGSEQCSACITSVRPLALEWVAKLTPCPPSESVPSVVEPFR